MKIFQNLNYRQWQKRNSIVLKNLTKSEEKEIREKGYRNTGWDNVRKSWLILQEFKPNVVSIFDYKLGKGDLVGAINIAMIDSDKTSEVASKAIVTLEENQQRLKQLAQEALNKYQLL